MPEEQKSDNKKHKKISLYKAFAVLRFVCGFLIISALSFYAVYEFAQVVSLYPSDTVDAGESIILESEGALTESRIEGVTDIFQLSEELSALTATHIEWTKIAEDKSQTGFFCIAEDKSSECIYNIDQNNICKSGYKLKDFNYIWIDSFSGSFYTVINISGRVIDFSDYYILVRDSSANLASRLIINCYEAEEVILKNTIFTGTLIAPNANVTYDDTVVNGQVYAESSVGMRASYRDVSFSGYYKMMSALKQADIKNECVRMAAVSYLKLNFPHIYGKLPDSYIPGEADLLRVKTLSISNANATDLTNDLKYFKRLQSFTATNSTINGIDFSDIKNLSKIRFSRCVIENLKFGELVSLLQLNVEGCQTDVIDISRCPAVTSVNYKATPIKKLVLPENSQIIYLNGADTNFKGFDEKQIASLSNLLYLDLANNTELKTIDLSVFPNLKKVDISRCGLTELSFENCMSLYYAKCSQNDFNLVDLSTAPVLIYFEAYSKNLRVVDASGLFKRGMAALYVYDTVVVVDKDPPQTEDTDDVIPPENENPDNTQAPDISVTPEGTIIPGETDVPSNTDLPGSTEPTVIPEETETIETPSETMSDDISQ